MIDGLVTLVVYSLLISVLFGLFMFALADLPMREPVRRGIWVGAVVFIGLIGLTLLLEVTGVTSIGYPQVRL